MSQKIRKLYYKFVLYSLLKGNRQPLESISEKKRCFVFLAADYGNLGDVAITYAQEKFLQQRLPDYEIVDVPKSRTLDDLLRIKKSIKPEDIITIVGGGNMGDMYFDLELLRLMVVKNFKNNKLISFPQTIDYSKSKDSEYLLKKSQRIYNSHPNITMCARETVSYWKMKELYPQTNVILTPDIVMTLDERTNDMRETRAIFCLRNDKEKSNNDEIVNKLLNYCKCAEIEVVKRDTHIGRNGLSIDERMTELQSIWDDFRKSQFVVTDRLHGMIFAYITGTPAIVLPNSNFKVAKCYEWIKECGYIQLINDNNININNLMNMVKIDKSKNIHSNIMSNFDNLLS